VLQRWAPIARRWRLDPVEPTTVVGDADRLGLALDALVENAVKHTGSGDEIRLGARRQGDLVAMVVADSGTGMPADQLEGIFERFARLDEARSRDLGGVGLGLAIQIPYPWSHGVEASGVLDLIDDPRSLERLRRAVVNLRPIWDETQDHESRLGRVCCPEHGDAVRFEGSDRSRHPRVTRERPELTPDGRIQIQLKFGGHGPLLPLGWFACMLALANTLPEVGAYANSS